ncbi:MAG: ABC transporter substrate-binding protein, partial [Rhodovibrionaceae bacterium]
MENRTQIEHPHIGTLKKEYLSGKASRREFLRMATLLGMSATAAYAFVGKGGSLVAPAQAAMPKGGTARIAMRVQELSTPHSWNWSVKSNIGRQVLEYLAVTGHDNVTRPHLLSSWEVSEDLRTWTLHVRQGVKWHNGRELTADDVEWNIRHILDEKTGSSVIGLMKGYMLEEYEDESDDSKHTRLWDSNAIEKVDDYTIRLNTKVPQIAVPEHLFHYPFTIMDPEEGGILEVGSNGTGPFQLAELTVGEKAVLTAAPNYWGEGPYLDSLEFIDLGEEASASLSALVSKQVDGMHTADLSVLDTLKDREDVVIHEATTAQTAVARMRVTEKPFDDPRVRKAMRLATDTRKVLEFAYRDRGAPGEHHHVSPVHPEYAELPFMGQDLEKAMSLLAEAGYPDGIDIKLDCKKDPAWELRAVQVMVEQWKGAGIRCEINVMPSAQYWDVWTKTPFGFTQWQHRPLGVMVLG